MGPEILTDPDYRVPSVPEADRGVAWLRAHVVRFSEGVVHRRRRRVVEDLLAEVDPATLRRPGHPVATLAEGLGLSRSITPDVEIVAGCYQPHLPVTREAEAAVARLVDAVGGAWDERAAARICLLVQACGAILAMLRGEDPPVPTTRRVAPSGAEVAVDLSAAPFGAGHHACPGRDHASALVEGARGFARLHDAPGPLVLPNAWDVGSALAFAAAGFAAVGTTSLGVAAAHGLPDAAGRTRQHTIALAARLARLPVPVTVDIEAGFGADPAELGAELGALGVAGVNLEDGRGDRLADPVEQAALVTRLKEAAPYLFVNARVDTHWLGIAPQSTLERAQRYVDAGADGVFVPSLTDRSEIERLVDRLPVPVNLLAQLEISTLRDLGVRRVSTGSAPYRSALHAALGAAVAARDGRPSPPAMGYDRVQGLVWP